MSLYLPVDDWTEDDELRAAILEDIAIEKQAEREEDAMEPSPRCTKCGCILAGPRRKKFCYVCDVKKEKPA